MTRQFDDHNISAGQKCVSNYLQKLGLIVESEFKIGRYYADIYLPELKIVVEYDGPHMHHSKRHDDHRDHGLMLMGVKRVIHIKDHKKETLENLARELGADV